MPNAVFGANEEANFAADCLLAPVETASAAPDSGEGRAVIAPAIAQLARKHISLRHRQSRAFAGHEGDTGRGIADQRRAAFCPAIQCESG